MRGIFLVVQLSAISAGPWTPENPGRIAAEHWEPVAVGPPLINDNPVIRCPGVQDGNWQDRGGDGSLHTDPMHAILVVGNAGITPLTCGRQIMARVTTNGDETLNTQHRYFQISAFVEEAESGASSTGDIHLPLFRNMLMRDFLCKGKCDDDDLNLAFDVQPTSRPEGLGYFVGSVKGELPCIGSPPSTDEDVYPMMAIALPQVLPQLLMNHMKICFKIFEMTGPAGIMKMQVLSKHNGDGPFVFRLPEWAMKTLCGEEAKREEGDPKDRVPFYCLITSKDTQTQTPTPPPGEQGGSLSHFAVSNCTEATLRNMSTKIEKTFEVCPDWPDARGCGSDGLPCPLIAHTLDHRCGDVLKFQSYAGSVHGQVTVLDRSIEGNEFGVASDGWPRICPYSCAEGDFLDLHNCFDSPHHCGRSGGIMEQSVDVCSCKEESCPRNMGEGHAPFQPWMSDQCNKDGNCCSSCNPQPPSCFNKIEQPTKVGNGGLGYQWIRNAVLPSEEDATAPTSKAFISHPPAAVVLIGLLRF